MLKVDRHVAQNLTPFVQKYQSFPGFLRSRDVDVVAPKFFSTGTNFMRVASINSKSYRQVENLKREPIQHRSWTESKYGLSGKRDLYSNQQIVLLILDKIEAIRHGTDESDFTIFADEVRATLKAWKDPDQGENIPSFFASLRQAYLDNGLPGIAIQIKYLYHGRAANRNASKSVILEQKRLADLRYPTEWYPATRMIKREIHLHVGPTNSGKTYNALKRLEQATSGIYASPLRLLAHEVYTRLIMKGKTCNLVTGDERIINEEAIATLSSCTVEMVPINCYVDVAVIDEIQMIGDEHRGWAWTQALLGIRAKEIHLCGEARTVPLIRELAASMGEKLEIHYYNRLSPLKTMSSSLYGNLKNLRKGDCVVAFSRISIHALKMDIEKLTKKQVAVVYGSLPPETRAQQAKLFNDPSNDYDFLVASDAIGMGLNLSIKRLIFESAMKFNGRFFETIPDNHIKQIAGRAGRYRTATQDQNDEEDTSKPKEGNILPKSSKRELVQNIGLVTTLEQMDLPKIIQAMQKDPEPVMSAGIFPPMDIISRFATYFPPNTPFSYVLLRLHELSLLHPRFRLCNLSDQIQVADVIQSVPNLTIRDRITFIAAPADARNGSVHQVIQALARCVANNENGALLDIREIDLSILNEPVKNDKSYLHALESLHKVLVLYLWLSYRFSGVFTTQKMAFYTKKLVEEKINAALTEVSSKPNVREKLKILRQKAMLGELWQKSQPKGPAVSQGKINQGMTSKDPSQPEFNHSSTQIAEDGIAAYFNGRTADNLSPSHEGDESTLDVMDEIKDSAGVPIQIPKRLVVSAAAQQI